MPARARPFLYFVQDGWQEMVEVLEDPAKASKNCPTVNAVLTRFPIDLTCLESRRTIPLRSSKSAPVESTSSDAVLRSLPGFVGRGHMKILQTLWSNQRGQDIAEYAVMLAVILLLVIGTIRLVGSNANNTFSSAASSIQ